MMMDVQLSESDDEFEIISIDPNINYESDDASMDEDDEFTPAPAVAVAIEESESATNQNTLNGSQQEAATMCEIMEVCTATSIKQEDELSCDSSTMTNLDNSLENSNDSTPLDCQQQKKVKRKLNLQEYKMRRANDPIEKFEDVPRSGKIIELCQDVPETLPPLPLPTDPCYLSQNQNKPKVWKEEEISKQHVQVVDKETPAMLHPDYEEIIIVSVACNTEVTVSPSEQDDEETGGDKFLKNIVNNLNKDSVETLMSSSSLFSSIQQVIQDKCSAANEDSKSISQENKSGNEHGEDKVIMHLRKDRQRPQQSCIAIQTDSISLFPPLILNPTLIFNRIRNVRSYRRKMSRSRSRSRSRSFSPSAVEFENRFNNKFDRRYARSQHSTHSSSLNSSESSSDSDSDSSSHYSSSRSSASSKQSDSKYSQSYAFFNQRNNQRNQKFGFPDERRIVYIGGLEEETSKDEIRRKFLNYGSIRKISLHVKEDGLRYGFVTFAEASSAYEVIETYTKDALISKYDIRFGGRRKFCKQSYADLDSFPNNNNNNNDYDDGAFNEKSSHAPSKDLSFEDLLKLAKKKLLPK